MFDPSGKKPHDINDSLTPDLFFSQDNLDLAMMGFTDGLESLEEDPLEGVETNLLYSMDSLDLFLCTTDELEKEAERRKAQREAAEKKP